MCACSQNPAYIHLSAAPKEASLHASIPGPSKCPANILQHQGGSSQEMPSLNPMYINLDPDHCHPVKNPALNHERETLS